MIVRARTDISEELIQELLKGKEYTLKVPPSLFFFNSGSSALQFLLQIIGKGKRVGVQVYTCSTVLNAIIAAECIPVFLDIDPNYYTTTINYVKEKINEIDILLLTHLFGIPNPDYVIIKRLCDDHNVEVIDDLCQTFHARIGTHYLEDLSDNYIYSFYYDKPISSVNGGMLKINEKYARKANTLYNQLPKNNNRIGCKNLKVLLLMHRLLDPEIYTKEFRGGMLWRRILEKCPVWINIHLLDTLVNSRLIAFFDKFVRGSGYSQLVRMSDVEIYYIQSIMNIYNNNNQILIGFLKNNNLNIPTYLTNKSICCSISKRAIINVKLESKDVQVSLYNWPKLICNTEDYHYYPNAVRVIQTHTNVPCWVKEPIYVNIAK